MRQIQCIQMERDALKKQQMIDEIKKDPALNKLFDEVNKLFTCLF
ncbi:hypothetical protein [Priestia taiwanensis]|nr:hypothetical protein [Priestia taiwanensis]MBM7361920.1 hypothetical protein [Priestia taiwanensis]